MCTLQTGKLCYYAININYILVLVYVQDCKRAQSLVLWGSSKYDRELNVVTCIFQTTLTQHGGHKVTRARQKKVLFL